MQVARTLFACVCLLAVAPAANAQSTNPIQKVISMLQELKAKNEKACKEGEVEFARFSQWAQDHIANLSDAMEKNNANIDENEAIMAERNALSNKMSEEIAAHESDVDRWESDIKAMTDVRGKEKTDYEATLNDYNESIDAIARAIDVLRSHEKHTAQASLLQVASLKRVPATAKAAIKSFLQVKGGPAGLEYRDASEANAYEFQSGGVVNMLKKLSDDFDGERRDLMSDESNSQHEYEMKNQEITDMIELAKDDIGRKTTRRGKANKEHAAAEAALTDEQAQLKENTQDKQDTVTERDMKTKDNEAMVKFCAGEAEAVQKAIDILQSKAVGGHAQANVDTDRGFFVQVMTSETPDQKEAVVDFLRNAGKKLGSARLTMLAMHANEAGPFKKVIGMIKDLIQKLREEARQEAEQKGWCDGELKANKVTRDDKTASVEELTERLNEIQATIAQRNEEVATLEKEIAEMEKAMADRTEQRNTEHKMNTQTIADAKAGAEATQTAMAVLKEFYDNNATPEKALGDHAQAGTNVLSFLEVVISDFNREESETELREKNDQDSFEKFIQDGKVSNAGKQASADGKKEETKRLAKNAEDTKKDIASTQKELDAANAYYEKLKPTCVDDGMSYEERVKAREAEITSLKEALELLK